MHDRQISSPTAHLKASNSIFFMLDDATRKELFDYLNLFKKITLIRNKKVPEKLKQS